MTANLVGPVSTGANVHLDEAEIAMAVAALRYIRRHVPLATEPNAFWEEVNSLVYKLNTAGLKWPGERVESILRGLESQEPIWLKKAG